MKILKEVVIPNEKFYKEILQYLYEKDKEKFYEIFAENFDFPIFDTWCYEKYFFAQKENDTYENT